MEESKEVREYRRLLDKATTRFRRCVILPRTARVTGIALSSGAFSEPLALVRQSPSPPLSVTVSRSLETRASVSVGRFGVAPGRKKC